MERVLALVLVFAVISSSNGLTKTFEGTSGKVTVDNGQVGIGEITGGSFGPGSFSIAGPDGVSYGLPANAVHHGGPIIISPPPKSGVQHQDNLPPETGGNFWNDGHNNQVYPQRAQANSGHREFALTTNGGRGGQLGGNFQGSQGVGFQGGQGGGSQGGQGGTFYPGLGAHGGQGGGFQSGQGATLYPSQGGKGGQGGGFQSGQGGGFQASQSGTFHPGQGVRRSQGDAFQNWQGRPGQAGSIQIGVISGGVFEKFPNHVKNSRNPNANIPSTGFNIGYSKAGKPQQLIHGNIGNIHEEYSDESSYSAESAEEPDAWVWGIS